MSKQAAEERIGAWLSAALEDPSVCQSMKDDINEWFKWVDREKEVPCKTHPDAPHGFNRNASHSMGRYVCDCEGWEEDESKD